MPQYRTGEDYYDPSYDRLSQQERLALKAEMVYEQKKKAAIAEAQAEAQQISLRREKKIGVMEEQRERIRYYEEAGVSPQFKESVSFYTSIGYPLYAGKYEAFTVPEGYKVSGITKTSKGLQVSFESTKPKGIAQTILEFDIPTYFADVMGLKGEKRERYLGITGTLTSPIHVLPAPFGTPVESVAGLVAYPESLVHTGTAFMGVQLPTRPPPPPGTTKGYTMGYAMGTVGTSLLAGEAFSKGVGLTIKGLQKVSPYVFSGIKKTGMVTFEKLVKPSVRYTLGSERYFYYKSVAYPTFRQLTLPSYIQTVKMGMNIYVKQPIGFVGKTVLGPQVYSFTKSVVLPNILHPRAFLGPTVAYWKGYLPSISLPTVHKPLPISMLKSVYAPNIMQLQKVVGPTLSYAKQAYMPRLTLPSLGIGKPLSLSMMKSVYLPNITQLQKVVKPTLSLAYQRTIGFYPHLPSLTL